MNTPDAIVRVSSYVYDGRKFDTEFEALRAQAGGRIRMLPDLSKGSKDELMGTIALLSSGDAETLSGILKAMCPLSQTEIPNRCFTTAEGQC